MTAIETHDGMVAAANAQQKRLGIPPEDQIWTGPILDRFRSDPRREPEGLLQAFLDLSRPDDVVLDVGGGGGRFCLPLALRCKEVINVDPSPGMHGVFDSVVEGAGIANARYVEADWLDADVYEADLTMLAHVTYFVEELERFVQKLESVTRRLIVIDVTATPNPNRRADLFGALWGEPQALAPGHTELLPALWEMGILPEVHILPASSFRGGGGGGHYFSSRAEAMKDLLTNNILSSQQPERDVELLEAHFDELFHPEGAGLRRHYRPDERQVLISWSPARR